MGGRDQRGLVLLAEIEQEMCASLDHGCQAELVEATTQRLRAMLPIVSEGVEVMVVKRQSDAVVRIPTKPAGYSDFKPATNPT